MENRSKLKIRNRRGEHGISFAVGSLICMTSTRTLTSALHLSLAIVFLALGSQSPLLAAAAPAWDLKDVKGDSVKLSDFKGKVVILDFWATWCPPCRAEIPHFIGLQEKYGKQGLVVVGVSVDEGGPDVVSSFVKANKINYPIVLGNLDVAQLYDATEGIPTTFVIDRTGNIVAKHLGFTDLEVFEKEIKSVL
jgi:thiol-disulfide isomerase/thioredoxin